MSELKGATTKMDDRKYLAGAIALCAVVYFLTHLHSTAATDRGSYTTNTVTGSTTFCAGNKCYATDGP
jgi:hypothetical protein